MVNILSYTFSGDLLVPILSVKLQTAVSLSGIFPGGVFLKLRYMVGRVCTGLRKLRDMRDIWCLYWAQEIERYMLFVMGPGLRNVPDFFQPVPDCVKASGLNSADTP